MPIPRAELFQRSSSPEILLVGIGASFVASGFVVLGSCLQARETYDSVNGRLDPGSHQETPGKVGSKRVEKKAGSRAGKKAGSRAGKKAGGRAGKKPSGKSTVRTMKNPTKETIGNHRNLTIPTVGVEAISSR